MRTMDGIHKLSSKVVMNVVFSIVETSLLLTLTSGKYPVSSSVISLGNYFYFN